MTQENYDAVLSIYSAFADGNVQAVFDRIDPDIEWIAADNSPAAKGSPYHGLDEVRDGVFGLIGAEFPELSMQVDEVLDAGDKIVVLGIYDGVRKTTGKRFHAQFAHIWTLGFGKAVKFQQYTDTLQFAQTAK
jgi:uncharacterized protein